jgi:hypothetical protein
MWKAWLLLPLAAALACGGSEHDAEVRYKKLMDAQRAKAGAPPDQLVSIGMSKGQSGTDVGIVYYAGGDRHDLTGTARTISGDRDYQLDGGGVMLRASDRSYGFKLVTPDSMSKVRWKVRLYPDKIKIADNDDDAAPRRIRVESPERATLAGPNEEPLGEIVFDGANTVVKNSSGVERYRKGTGKLEPSYAVFLFDRMPNVEKYIVMAELMARNR